MTQMHIARTSNKGGYFRTNIFLAHRQRKELRKLVRATGIRYSELIRIAVDSYIDAALSAPADKEEVTAK